MDLTSLPRNKRYGPWANGSQKPPLDGNVASIAFSPDGKTLAVASGERTVELWNVATHQHVLTLEAGKDNIQAVAFSPDGKMLLAGGEKGIVYMWSAAQK